MSESYAMVLCQTFHNQMDIQQKFQDLFKHSLTLSQITLKRSKSVANTLPILETTKTMQPIEKKQITIDEIKIEDSTDDIDSILAISNSENVDVSNLLPEQTIYSDYNDDDDNYIEAKQKNEHEQLLNDISITQKKYTCNKCGYATHFPSNLRRHENTHLNKPFKCVFCPKKFKNSELLNMHYMQEHELLKKFKYICNNCSFKCNSQKTFDSHSKSHDDEKSLQCDHCNKIFANLLTLKQHQRSIQRLSIC